MRRNLPEHFPLHQRLAHQAKLIVFEIAQAAVNQFARPRRRAAGEIVHFTKEDRIFHGPRHRGDSAAVDPAANDCEVENLSHRVSPALAIFKTSDFAFGYD